LINITIDSREPQAVISYLKRKYKGKINFNTVLLNEGDFLSDHAIVERKEIGDLYSSILDGRLKNQCCKMALHDKVPVLVIHGNLTEYAKMIRYKKKIIVNEQMVISIIAECMCQYHMLVIWTEDIHNCLSLMVSLIVDIEEEKYMQPGTCKPEQLFARAFKINVKQFQELTKIVGNVSQIAKSTKTQLMRVKGIGEVKAQHILNILNGKVENNDTKKSTRTNAKRTKRKTNV